MYHSFSNNLIDSKSNEIYLIEKLPDFLALYYELLTVILARRYIIFCIAKKTLYVRQ